MEGFRLVGRIDFYLVVGCQDFVVDRTPPIIFYTLIPALVRVSFILVELDIDRGLLLLLLDLVVISGRKRVDVYDRAVDKYLVVDEWWELQAAQTKSDVASRGWVHKVRLSPIDTFQKLVRITLVLEVDEILVVSVDPHVRIRPPGSLDLFCGDLVLRFEFDLFLAFKVASPGPLDLNGCNMVHGESMVFEKSSGQGHLVRCLDNSSTEIAQTLILIFMHHVERGGQELLPQLLCGREMGTTRL